MSFDFSNEGFTEDEIAEGVVYGNYDDDEDDDYASDTKVNRKEIEPSVKEHVSHKLDNTEIKIIKIVSALDNHIAIKNKVIRKILLESLDDMIENYMQKEALPYEFVKVSKQKNGLETLIKYFLKNDGGYVLNKKLLSEIDILLDDIYTNHQLDIVYERVGKIQKFIHQKIDDKYGYGTHLNLDSIKIKHLLSSARLHLNIFDIKNYNINRLMHLIEESKKKSFEAYMSSTGNIFSSNKFCYYPLWKARGMKSLIYFLEPYIQDKIYGIYFLDEKDTMKVFKDKIVEIYLKTSSINSEKVYNQLSESEWILLNMKKNRWQEQV